MNPERFKQLFPRASDDTIKANTGNDLVCIGCGQEFTPCARSRPEPKYCSQSCASKHVGKTTMKLNRRSVPRTKFSKKQCPVCGKEFESWDAADRKYCSVACSSASVDRRLKSVTERAKNTSAMTYSRCQRQWVELGERRFFAKSKWEAYYGIFLEWERKNGRISDWKYEPMRFWFSGIHRGTMSYLPDFEVTETDGSKTYREVKGWMDKISATRLKRMKKYHPTVKVTVIDKAWFKGNKMLLSIITLEHFREDISK